MRSGIREARSTWRNQMSSTREVAERIAREWFENPNVGDDEAFIDYLTSALQHREQEVRKEERERAAQIFRCHTDSTECDHDNSCAVEAVKQIQAETFVPPRYRPRWDCFFCDAVAMTTAEVKNHSCEEQQIVTTALAQRSSRIWIRPNLASDAGGIKHGTYYTEAVPGGVPYQPEGASVAIRRDSAREGEQSNG
jgi:hypothetical protein